MATLCQTEHHPAKSPVTEEESVITEKKHTPRLPPNTVWALKYLGLRDPSAGGRMFGLKISEKSLQRNVTKQSASRKSLHWFKLSCRNKMHSSIYILCKKGSPFLFRTSQDVPAACFFLYQSRKRISGLSQFYGHSTIPVFLPPIARGYLLSKLEDEL